MLVFRKQQEFRGAKKTTASHWASGLFVGLILNGVVGCQQSSSPPVAQQTEAETSQELVQPIANMGESGQIEMETGSAEQPILVVQAASQTNIRQNAPYYGATGVSTDGPLTLTEQAASGTPEWDIQQIAAILKEAQKNSAGKDPSERRLHVTEEQNRRIVALATHAVTQTHSRPEKELLFNTAIHSLVDARLQLALAGDQKSLDAIYEDAVTLAEKHPQSSAAATSAGAVVRLAAAMAAEGDRQSPWISEYVRQAKLFAANYPNEEARAIVQLTAAAEFCEQRQLILPAVECYTFIQQKFPNSPFNQRSEAALQRLNLVGKTIPVQGTNLQGETIQLSDFQGQPVLIAFWSSRSSTFVEDLPVIRELCERSGCQLLGINLDTEESNVRQFMTAHQLPGQHIFAPEASLRGAAQPLARQYGVHVLPAYWLVDKEGKVLSTCVSRTQLQALLK